MNRFKSIALWSLISLVIAATAFICVDCSCGTTLRYDCMVAGRNHVEAWTSSTVTYDEDGGFHVDTVHHPDEWHLYCNPVEDGAPFDVNTSAQHFNTITNGQAVSVRVRQGRWTGARYLPIIDE